MKKKTVIIILICLFAATFVGSGIWLLTMTGEYAAAEEVYDDAAERFFTVSTATASDGSSETAQTSASVGADTDNASSDSSSDTVSSDAPETETVSEPEPQPAVDAFSVDLAALRAVNSEAVGWIYVPDTVISYPLMQSGDNEKYLSLTYNGKANRSGSIFLDYRCSPDLSDRNTVIYGHNMRDSRMFAGLRSFGTQKYFDSRRVFYIALDSGVKKYEIFSAFTTTETGPAYDLSFADDEEYAAFLHEVSRLSEIATGVTVTTGDKIVTLSTCTSGDDKTERFVVLGRLAE